MVKLADLGFFKGTIYETIASTFNPDGNPNAAPMGVIMQNEQQVALIILDQTSALFLTFSGTRVTP